MSLVGNPYINPDIKLLPSSLGTQEKAVILETAAEISHAEDVLHEDAPTLRSPYTTTSINMVPSALVDRGPYIPTLKDRYGMRNKWKSVSAKLTTVFLIYLLFLFGMQVSSSAFEKHPQISSARSITAQIHESSNNTNPTSEILNEYFPQTDDYLSKSVLVYDLDTNQKLFTKNSANRTLIASITKIVSSQVLYKTVDMNKTTVIDETVEKIDGGSLQFKKGNEYKNLDLIKAALVSSSNQSVYAMQDPNITVRQMNDFARTLGLQNTHFSNPAGFDDNGDNYSTAEDLVPIARLFFQNTTLRAFASTKFSEITELKDDKKIRLVNTDDLLRIGTTGVIAGKTGTTPAAGQNLLLLVGKNSKQYLIVLLNGSDRYDDAKKVLDRL